eukprot:356894-Chlamydomonas_euryale.AAC.5
MKKNERLAACVATWRVMSRLSSCPRGMYPASTVPKSTYPQNSAMTEHTRAAFGRWSHSHDCALATPRRCRQLTCLLARSFNRVRPCPT